MPVRRKTAHRISHRREPRRRHREGEDIFGDGVNVAARMESIAAPGGIAISGTVRDHIGNRLDLAFEDMGEQTLKNIERPVRIYRVHLDTPAVRAQGQKVGVARRRKTINRCPALQQHERRSGTGIFQRWHHRGHHHRPVESVRIAGHRPQHRIHLQGQSGKSSAGSAGARGSFHP